MPRYGIDTSVFVRLLTGDPAQEYADSVEALRAVLQSVPGTTIVVSNQVIGEAYVALQHHYGVNKTDARQAMVSVFQSGLVAPQNGASVLAALNTRTGCGLLDRLITEDYHQHGCITLTRDRRMAKLPGAQLL
jgi:predicted nucleic acid-binding protein